MWLQVIESPLILFRFLSIFIPNDEHSCLNYCIFTKISQIVCLINRYILTCRHARCDYKVQKVIWFNCFEEFSMFETLFLHQTFTHFVDNFILPYVIVCYGKMSVIWSFNAKITKILRKSTIMLVKFAAQI